MEMTPQLKELLYIIKSNMKVAVGQELVERSFPAYILPRPLDMERLTKNLLAGTPVVEEQLAILEYKPTSQMIEDFCETNGLAYSFDPLEHTFYFGLKL